MRFKRIDKQPKGLNKKLLGLNNRHFFGSISIYLSTYSSEMNLIETEWHQIKTHELAGRIFEDEYDLTISVIKGVEAFAQRGQYDT